MGAAAFSRPLFEGRPILHHALSVGERTASLDVVKELLKIAAESDALSQVDEKGDTVHLLAIKAGREYVDALLKTEGVNWGMAVDNVGNTPLTWMVGNAGAPFDKDVFSLILEKYPQALDRVNKLGENILHIACKTGDPDRIEACIGKVTQKGYEKDLSTMLAHQDGLGDTPLHIGFRTLDGEATGVLFDHILDADGNITADLAVQNSEGKSVVRTILSKDLRLLERFHNEESCRREVGYAMTGTKKKGSPQQMTHQLQAAQKQHA